MHKLSTKFEFMLIALDGRPLQVVVYADDNKTKSKVFNIARPVGVDKGDFHNRICNHFNSLTDQQIQDYMKSATTMDSLHQYYSTMPFDQVYHSEFIFRSVDYDFSMESKND